MRLSDLGFDRWFQARAEGALPAGRALARVTAVDRGAYLVSNESRELPAELAGKSRFLAETSVDLPCVGDWVAVQYHNADASAIIHAVLPRKTFLRRKCAGDNVDFQMIAANIDTAFIVQSCRFDFNLHRLDRYLVMLEQGAMLIDTPGMRELGLLAVDDGLDQSFADIRGLARDCRYGDCSHTQEPGCAVLRAIAEGELSEERHRSYRKLKKESQFQALSYLDRRQKDEAFGRFLKSVKKNLKK